MRRRNLPDATELWKLSADKFKHESKYLNENGILVSSVEQLPSKVRDIVRQKLKQQINKNNARGILFYSDSTLAQGIGESEEFVRYIRDNIEILSQGKIIETGSTYFGSDENLKLALGHVDILFTEIDQNGNINAIIMDTYDFNKNDPDWKVQIAYNVQKHGLIENYYILIHVRIPLSNILNYN